MADNFLVNDTTSVGVTFAAAEMTFSGDTTLMSGVFQCIISGAEGSWTPTVIVGGAGAVTAGTQRMTLASDDPAVAKLTTIDADTSTLAAVDFATQTTLAVIAGDTTSLDGKVTACDTGAVVLASGTVTTVSTVTNLAQLGGQAVSMGTGARDAGTQRVTIATDDSVPVTGTFYQATQPVSGTVAVTGMTACNTGAVVISSGTITTVSSVTAIANALPAGDNNIGNVDIVTLPSGNLGMQAMAASLSVVPASNITDATYIGDIKFGEALPAGTNAIGKLAANSGVDIGDVDVTSIAAGSSTIGGVIAQPSVSTAYDGTTATTMKRATGIATDSGINAMVSAVAGYQIRVLALSLIATSTTAVSLYVYNVDYMLLGDGTNKITLDMDGVGGPAGLVLPFNPGGWFQTDTDNEALSINLSAATPVIWAVTYVEVT